MMSSPTTMTSPVETKGTKSSRRSKNMTENNPSLAALAQDHYVDA